MPGRFSIILPIRNGGEYAKLCVNSILNQTIRDFNLIVLDNASTDGALQWIQSLNDNRIIIFSSQKSLSIEENWSRIKTVPKNEFMTMIGHDDILKPFYLEEMDKLINLHPDAGLFQTHYSYIDKDGKITRKCLPMDEVQKSYEFLACQMNGTIDSTGTGYMMCSADFDKLGGMPVNYPNLIFSDYELWIKLSKNSYKATAQRECFEYREHMSVSRATNGEQYEAAFGQYVHFLSTLRNEEHFAEVIARYGHKMLLYFCESLSHRVLKTPVNKRKIRVKDVVKNFHVYADLLIPGQSFQPMGIPGIRYASWLDQSVLTRNTFNFINKFRH
ncbi:MAG: glycosyltransferase [Chitinophagaceae bacterium]|nr:glycosyltransferase [Chitinophagaceae bacterium]